MNLQTRYMGLELRSPIVVSACPLSESVDNIVQMEDAGAGAVVLFSLFEEQIRREQALYEQVQEATTNTFAEAAGFLPAMDAYKTGPSGYLELIRRAKERVKIPVIASLNGVTPEGWIGYARQIEQAGADGLELNVYYLATDIAAEGRDVEERCVRVVRQVADTVRLPVAVKLNPYFSAMGEMAATLAKVGARALVLFNRVFQPEYDVERLQVLRHVDLSRAAEIRLPLLWISALHERTGASLAATTGVEGAREVVKYLLAGADVVMTASALYRHGIGHLLTMHQGLEDWMERKQFESVDAFRGVLSQRNVANTSAHQRATYMRILEEMKRA